eukprot:Opistho-2@73936
MAHVQPNGLHAPIAGAPFGARPPFPGSAAGPVAVPGQPPMHPHALHPQQQQHTFPTGYGPMEGGGYRPSVPQRYTAPGPTSATAGPGAGGIGGIGGVDAFGNDEDGSNDEGGAGGGAHSWAKNSPATIQWLVDNYETAEGVSLPRSTLYEHYQEYCTVSGVDPVNAASFGKLIRHIFPNLKTRRLGTRGNSKYHYYGIRVKPTSSLAAHHANDDNGDASGPPHYGHQGGAYGADGRGGSAVDAHAQPGQRGREDAGQGHTAGSDSQHPQHTGGAPAPASTSLPDFGPLDAPPPPDVPAEHMSILATTYRAHCERVLDIVSRANFNDVETTWRHFWQTIPDHFRRLLVIPAVVAHIQRCDSLLYETLVDVLVPDVLRPLPVALTQSIRHFAKSLEGWLTFALEGQPQALVMAKLTAVAAFSQTLRRYTSLNHLAQAARAVLHNADQITHMLSDLNRVDFGNVHEQAAWVCQCPDDVVRRLEGEFKQYLQQQHTLEQWAQWLQRVVADALGTRGERDKEGGAGSAGVPDSRPPASMQTARQFLMKWSFYSSLVIRDLTLRSAQSFGSFHLMRLLYDEYMFYLVERHVAAHGSGAVVGILARDFTAPVVVSAHGDTDSSSKDRDDTIDARVGGDVKPAELAIPGQVDGVAGGNAAGEGEDAPITGTGEAAAAAAAAVAVTGLVNGGKRAREDDGTDHDSRAKHARTAE